MACAGCVPTWAQVVVEAESEASGTASGTKAASPSSVIERPSVAGRVVKIFDFEERLTNPSPVPMGWFRAQSTIKEPERRRGFPHWNHAELVYTSDGLRSGKGVDVRGANASSQALQRERGGGGQDAQERANAIALSGEGAVRLGTQGGSVGLALEPGVLPIFAGADYWVSAVVQTQELRNARATLRASLLDAKGNEINGSVGYAPLTIAEGKWKPLGVEVLGAHPAAAFMRIELQVLQPEDVPLVGRTQFGTFVQDVAGAATFDDVVIVQIPRVELSIDAPNNVFEGVFEGTKKPTLRATVRDLSGEELSLDISILDIDGKVVDSTRSRLGVGQGALVFTPKLPGYGWYRATMDVLGPDGRVGGSASDFVWVAAAASGALSRTGLRMAEVPQRMMGMAMVTLPDSFMMEMPKLMEQANVGWASMAAWRQEDDLAAVTSRADRIRTVVERVSADGRMLTLGLDRGPSALALAAKTPAEEVWTLLTRSDAAAEPYFAPIADRIGQAVVRWQIGAVGDDTAFWKNTSVLQNARRALARKAAAPVIVVPTRASAGWSSTAMRALGDDAMWLFVADDTVSSRGVGDLARTLVSDFAGASAAPERVVLLQRMDPLVYGVRDGARHMAHAMAEFWANGKRADVLDMRLGLAIDQPWRVQQGRRPQLMPTPELAIWRAMGSALVDRVVVGPFDATAGIRGVVLAPMAGARNGREGALLLWNDGAAAEDAYIEAFLGSGDIRIVDCFGNARPAPNAAAKPGQTGRAVRIDVGDWPVVVEGVDVNLVRFLASIKIDEPFVPSTSDVHARAIELMNPWPVAISGRVVILEPGGYEASSGRQRDRKWRVGPRSIPFVMDPGARESLKFDLSFAPSEEIGKHLVVMRVELAADKEYGSILATREIEIGLPGVRMDLAYSLSGVNGNDVVVEASVANGGATPLTLDMTSFAPDLPRAKGVITDLKNGNRTVVRFAFANSYAKLRGKRVIVSAVEPDGGRRITASLRIE